MLIPIADELLVVVYGAAEGDMCTEQNPNGVSHQTYVTNIRDANGRILTDWNEIQRQGRPAYVRAAEAVDRALAPWRLFNDLFGGAAFDAPRPAYTPF